MREDNSLKSLPLTELRPTVMEVDLDALSSNLKVIRSQVFPARVMAVLKANAYGHGLAVCARVIEAGGVDYFGVAFVEEGILLRKAGISKPILVFGGIFGGQIRLYLDNDLELTASSVDKLEAIDQAAAAAKKIARVHLKIDTGMERIGVHHYSATPLLEASLRAKNCQIVGVFSHLASAEENTPLRKLQLERFLSTVDFFNKRSVPLPLRHLANSGGVIDFPESHLDLVRPGVALYGALPSEHLKGKMNLQPVMTLRSKVVYFKVVKKGSGVSYNHRWIAKEDTRVVTIPVGYGDGFFRGLSNRGFVLIRGKRYPIVGSVCMDQMMVDIGPDGTAYNGDDVVLIGRQEKEEITVGQVAELANTIPHDVLTSTNLRVPRIYRQGKNVWAE